MCIKMRLIVKFFIISSFLYVVRTDCPYIVSRQTWIAINPVHVQYLVHPVSIVIIQHTASEVCGSEKNCVTVLQNLQYYYIEKLGTWDIGASFYIGNDAKIYEGTGWVHAGFHTPGFDNKSIAISFIGNYNDIAPTTAQLNAAKALIQCGIQEGFIMQEYSVVVHRQLYATQSPGRKLYNAIRAWPDWLEDANILKNSTSSKK